MEVSYTSSDDPGSQRRLLRTGLSATPAPKAKAQNGCELRLNSTSHHGSRKPDVVVIIVVIVVPANTVTLHTNYK